MSNVIVLPVVTTLDLNPQRVLDAAKDAGLDSVVVVGYDKDGNEYMATSIADGGEVNWLLDRMKHKLMMISEDIP